MRDRITGSSALSSLLSEDPVVPICSYELYEHELVEGEIER